MKITKQDIDHNVVRLVKETLCGWLKQRMTRDGRIITSDWWMV